MAKRFKTFSQGNLSDEFPRSESKDEVADMMAEAGKMAQNLSSIVKDAGYIMGEMSVGDYAVVSRMPEEYVGEMSGLLEAMEKMKEQMRGTLREIRSSPGELGYCRGILSHQRRAVCPGSYIERIGGQIPFTVDLEILLNAAVFFEITYF